MTIWQILSIVCFLISFAAYVYVAIEAFKDEIWKGAACLFCGIYAIYYVLKEWDGENQGLVLLAMIGGGLLGRMMPLFAAMQQVGAGK
jgi:hypothetical protein